jgi:DNA-binding protein Fis
VLAETIRLSRGNQSKAARWLGISRLTLREKLTQYGLHPKGTGE